MCWEPIGEMFKKFNVVCMVFARCESNTLGVSCGLSAFTTDFSFEGRGFRSIFLIKC